MYNRLRACLVGEMRTVFWNREKEKDAMKHVTKHIFYNFNSIIYQKSTVHIFKSCF